MILAFICNNIHVFLIKNMAINPGPWVLAPYKTRYCTYNL